MSQAEQAQPAFRRYKLSPGDLLVLASCEVLDESLVPCDYRRTRVGVDRAAVLHHSRETGEVIAGTLIVTDRRHLPIS